MFGGEEARSPVTWPSLSVFSVFSFQGGLANQVGTQKIQRVILLGFSRGFGFVYGVCVFIF